MYMSKKWLLALIFVPIMSYAQRNVDAIVDTVESKNGTAKISRNISSRGHQCVATP